MASVVKRLVTEWVYRVDTSQLKKAQQEVTKLTGKLNGAHAASAKLFNQEARNVKALITQYGLLTAAVARFGNTRNMAFGGGGMIPFAPTLAGARAAGGIMNFAGSGLTAAEKSRMAQQAKKSKGSNTTPSSSTKRAPQAFTSRALQKRPRGLLGNFGPNMNKSKPATAIRAGKGGASLLGFGLGGVAAVGAFEGLKSAIGAGAQHELTERNFTMMLKSENKAADLIEKLNQFAVKTPFQVKELRESATKLLGSGFDFDGSDVGVMATLKDLGNISMGSSDKFNRLIMNMADIRNKTTMDKRDVKQFAAVGIDILGAIGKNEQKTNDQLLTMVSQNKVTYKMVREGIKYMTGREGRFNNALENQSQTLSGAFSNLKDIAFIIQEDATKGGIKDRLKDMVTTLKETLVANRATLSSTISGIGHGALNSLGGSGMTEILKALGLNEEQAKGIGGVLAQLGGMGLIMKKMPTAGRFMIASDLVQSIGGALRNDEIGDKMIEGTVIGAATKKATEWAWNTWKTFTLKGYAEKFKTAEAVQAEMKRLQEEKKEVKKTYGDGWTSWLLNRKNNTHIERLARLNQIYLKKDGDIEGAYEDGLFSGRGGYMGNVANGDGMLNQNTINNQFIPKVEINFHSDVYGSDALTDKITDIFNGKIKSNNVQN